MFVFSHVLSRTFVKTDERCRSEEISRSPVSPASFHSPLALFRNGLRIALGSVWNSPTLSILNLAGDFGLLGLNPQ